MKGSTVVKNTILTSALAFIVMSAINLPASAAKFALIVNANTKYDGAPEKAKEQVRRLFLKQHADWPGGTVAIALARSPNSPAENAFSKDILGMSETELNEHWLKLKQTRGETPPRAVASDRILLRLIGKKPGAFSYIALDDFVETEGVEILIEFGD